MVNKVNNKGTNALLQIETGNLATMREEEWMGKKKEIKEVIVILREEAYRAQNAIKIKEIKEVIEQRCQHFQNNQRKMIDSLTNNQKKSIQIDRIMVIADQGKHIVTDPTEVKKEVNKYYTKAFRRRKTDFERLNESWKKQYEPRDYIEQE